MFLPLISEFSCDLLGTNRNVADATLPWLPKLSLEGRGNFPLPHWSITTLSCRVSSPTSWGHHAVKKPEVSQVERPHGEPPRRRGEREREMLSQTPAPTVPATASFQSLRRPRARTTYRCPSQISDPQKLWGDPINYTNISTKLPTIPHLIQHSKSMEGERKNLGTLCTICSFLQTAL